VAPTEVPQRIELTPANIPDAEKLSIEAGWNQTAADWAVFIKYGKVFGLLTQDRLVATAAVLPYGEEFGWISMVIVTAAWRLRGLARRLTGDCIENLRSAGRAALLDATQDGAAVYAALGFAPLCTMQRWTGTGRGNAPVPRHDEPARLDAEAFGADRGFLLGNFLSRPGAAAVTRPGGFALLRPGRLATQIGPIVAPDADRARDLLDAAIDAASGPVIVDILQQGATLAPRLEAAGFAHRRSFLRMALGRDRLPGVPARLLAAAGPEFG